MVPLINLLPNYRQEQRKAKGQRFMNFLAGSVVAAGLLIGAGHLLIGAKQSVQDHRNAYLQSEINGINTQITEINRLKTQTQQMLARRRAVETLQASRSQTIALLNEIDKTPEGVYYSAVRENGTQISLTGYAQSNFHVATLIRQLETSRVLTAPRLIESRQVSDPLDGNNRVVEFSIECKLQPMSSSVATQAPKVQVLPNGTIISSTGILPNEVPPPPQANDFNASGTNNSAFPPPRGGPLGATAHTALDAAHRAADIAARPPPDMAQAERQSR